MYRWIVEASNKIEFVETQEEIKEMEFDEIWHYINKKKENFGLSKHLSVAQVELSHGIGGLDTATFRRLYKKVSKITGNCIFYTDNWDTFAKVLPQDRHIIGKSHTSAIERDNSII